MKQFQTGIEKVCITGVSDMGTKKEAIPKGWLLFYFIGGGI
ncbi:hypothetical protein [Rhodonellum sp.]|nr:hypothetical protein [Rhodonellum sp.]MDO9554724.1 hypothetical protein [Rhodonellum sp.]